MLRGPAATDTPRLASSRYRLTRQLSPDMTSSVHLSFDTHRVVLVRSFSYIPRDGFSEELLLHSSVNALLVKSIPYTPRELVLVRSFSYTPRAAFSKEFLLHCSSCF